MLVRDAGNALDSVTYSQDGGLRCTAGQSFSFVIDSRDPAARSVLDSCSQCSGYVMVLKSSAQQSCDSCTKTINPELIDGLAKGNITLVIGGSWNVAVYVFNFATRLSMHIHGSPLTIQVTANKISPSNCIAEGGGLVGTSLGREAKVIITVRDAWDNDRVSLEEPPDEVTMSISGMDYRFNSVFNFTQSSSNQDHNPLLFHGAKRLGHTWVSMSDATADALVAPDFPVRIKLASSYQSLEAVPFHVTLVNVFETVHAKRDLGASISLSTMVSI